MFSFCHLAVDCDKLKCFFRLNDEIVLSTVMDYVFASRQVLVKAYISHLRQQLAHQLFQIQNIYKDSLQRSGELGRAAITSLPFDILCLQSGERIHPK